MILKYLTIFALLCGCRSMPVGSMGGGFNPGIGGFGSSGTSPEELEKKQKEEDKKIREDEFSSRNVLIKISKTRSLLSHESLKVKKNFLTRLTHNKSSCQPLPEVRVHVYPKPPTDFSMPNEIQKVLLNLEATEYFNTVDSKPADYNIYYISPYKCFKYKETAEYKKDAKKFHRFNELRLLAGTYTQRMGVLEKFGKTGASFGFHFNKFKNYSQEKYNRHGWYLLFNFDDVQGPRASMLRAKFRDEDFISYIWSLGYSYRVNWEDWTFNYSIGPGFHFVEVDTHRTNDKLKDEEATDHVISLVQKFGIDYYVGQDRNQDVRVGTSVFYYWSDDPLAKFDNLKSTTTGGGSIAYFLELIFQFD